MELIYYKTLILIFLISTVSAYSTSATISFEIKERIYVEGTPVNTTYIKVSNVDYNKINDYSSIGNIGSFLWKPMEQMENLCFQYIMPNLKIALQSGAKPLQ